jgi:hypothetical protein
MLVSVSKVERYRREANRCAELAKEAQPAFLAEIYRKVALRYVFMAEELLRGSIRDRDAIEKADRMNSSLRVADGSLGCGVGFGGPRPGMIPKGMGVAT